MLSRLPGASFDRMYIVADLDAIDGVAASSDEEEHRSRCFVLGSICITGDHIHFDGILTKSALKYT